MVGAMKAGTTSFVEVLSQHPQLFVPPIKEPHYFVDSLPKELYEPSRFFDLAHYFETDFPQSLHITKVENNEHYKKLFSGAKTEQYLLDASTAYLHAQESARHIFKYNPNAKIIVLLRDPIKRAFSQYKMDVGLGMIRTSFEKMIIDDIENYNNGVLPWYTYLGMSLYARAVRRYQELFKDVLVLNFEDFIKYNDQFLNELTTFLDIEPFEKMEIDHKNEAMRPKFKNLFYALKQMGFKDYFSKVFSNNFKQWVFKVTSSKKGISMDLSEKIQEQLHEIFNNESKI